MQYNTNIIIILLLLLFIQLTLNTELDHHLVQGTMLAAVIPSVLTSAGSLLAGGHTPVTLAAGEREREQGEGTEERRERGIRNAAT